MNPKETPYIDRPDAIKPDGSEIFCFMDQDRVCDATCISYLTIPPDGAEYTGQVWSNCILLVTAYRVANSGISISENLKRHLPVVVRNMDKPKPMSPIDPLGRK